MSTQERTLTVQKFMTEKPCTVDAGLSIADAQQRMSQNNIRHLLVVSGDRLVGVVSSRDLAVVAGMPDVSPDKTEVTVAMRPSVYVCDVGTPLESVALDMEMHRYGCAVVVDDGHATGIFTTTDALRALRELATGEPAEPAAPPTHLQAPPSEEERPRREHHFRVGDALLRAHVSPSAHQGMIR